MTHVLEIPIYILNFIAFILEVVTKSIKVVSKVVVRLWGWFSGVGLLEINKVADFSFVVVNVKFEADGSELLIFGVVVVLIDLFVEYLGHMVNFLFIVGQLGFFFG